jgi:hypothetical protein
MKKYFTNCALLIGVAALSTGLASAASVCVTTTVDVTTLNAGGGCTVGGLTFNNFQVSAGTVGITGINNPGTGGVGLNFNPNLTNSATLNDIHFSFSVTGPANSISSVYLYDGATFVTGSASIGEEICNSLGVNMSGLCASGPGTALANLNANGGQQASAIFAAQTTVYVWKDINIGGDAHLSSFDQNFGTSAVPEPATFSMLGLGLVGLGVMGRRLRKNS